MLFFFGCHEHKHPCVKVIKLRWLSMYYSSQIFYFMDWIKSAVHFASRGQFQPRERGRWTIQPWRYGTTAGWGCSVPSFLLLFSPPRRSSTPWRDRKAELLQSALRLAQPGASKFHGRPLLLLRFARSILSGKFSSHPGPGCTAPVRQNACAAAFCSIMCRLCGSKSYMFL